MPNTAPVEARGRNNASRRCSSDGLGVEDGERWIERVNLTPHGILDCALADNGVVRIAHHDRVSSGGWIVAEVLRERAIEDRPAILTQGARL